MEWVGPTSAVSEFYCKICDLTFMDQRNFNLHRADRMHLQKCYQMEYNVNQPTSFAPDARQILALYSNDNTGYVTSSPASFHSLDNPQGPTRRDARKRFCESSGSNFNIRYQPQSSVSASPQTSSKKPKLADKPTFEEFKSPSLSLSPSSSIGSNVCSVFDKKPASSSSLLTNSMEKVCHKNNILKDTLSKIKSLMGSLEKYKLLPKSTAIAATLDLDLNVLVEKPSQRLAKPSEVPKLSEIKINQKLCLLAEGTSSSVSLNNSEYLGKSKGNRSPERKQVPREIFSRLSSSSAAATNLVTTSSKHVSRNPFPNQLSAGFISSKIEAGRSMTKTSLTDPILDTRLEGPSTSGTVNKLSGKLSPNVFDRFSEDRHKNKTTTASNPVGSARKSLQGSVASKDNSQSHAAKKSNDNKVNASKLALLPTPPVNSFPTAGPVSSSDVKKPLLPVPSGALLSEPTTALLPEPTAALLPVPTAALLPEPKVTEVKPAAAALIHSEKLVNLQEKLKKTLENCETFGGKKALSEEQVKDLEVNEMLILINTIMTKIIQDITKDRPSKFSVVEVLDCGINQKGDLFSELEKLFGRDKPHQLTELVKALKSIDQKVLQGLKELLEKDQIATKLNKERKTCSPHASAPPRGIASASAKVKKDNNRGLLDRPETSTDLKNGSATQLGKAVSGKYFTQSSRDARALLPTPKGALLPTPNASGPQFRQFF